MEQRSISNLPIEERRRNDKSSLRVNFAAHCSTSPTCPLNADGAVNSSARRHLRRGQWRERALWSHETFSCAPVIVTAQADAMNKGHLSSYPGGLYVLNVTEVSARPA
jgi:hypothetical protein